MSNPPVPNDPYAPIAAALPDFDDDAEAMLTVRQQSLADPPRGAPMNVAKIGDDDDWIEPAGWRLTYYHKRTGLPLNCPVVPLGKNMDVFYFLNTLGEVHTLQANAGKGHIDALFAGRNRLYLPWAWPRLTAPKKEGDPWTVTNWAAEDARQDLFSACAFMGTFELDDRVRGRGAWRDDNGALIYHAGDAVWIDGRWRPPGQYGRFIYPGRPKIGRPGRTYEDAGEGSPGDILLQALQSWNWERGELDARLALGWLMIALVGGALAQRPSVFITGTEGAGKSTLLNLLKWIMNGALVSTGNTTQAGIYQKVKQDSIAVIVDEMADKEDTRNSDKILELARVAYSGDKMNRGGKDGVGVEFAVMSSFLFSSIGLPSMDSQDASRMGVLQMRERPRPKPGEKMVNVLAELGLREAKNAQALGSHLLKRMFTWFDRWDELRELFRDALVEAGHEDRSADTFCALAAGCHVALSDELPDQVTLKQWADWLRADTLSETANREKTWQRCFWHLMDAAPEALKHNNHHKSIGSAVLAFQRSANGVDDLIKVLNTCGMALSFPKGAEKSIEHARLFVPSKSPPLHALFEGTPWAGRLGAPGPWGTVLRQMPREHWMVSTCDKGLNKAAKGLMISLSPVVGAARTDSEED